MIHKDNKKTDKHKEKQIFYYRQKWAKLSERPKSKVVCFFSTVALDKIIKLLPLNYEGKKVLITCGGGDGFEIEKMESLKADLTVTDISKESLTRLQKDFPECKVRVADAENLPFKDNFFDMGLVKDGLHHLVDPQAGIKELYRVCKNSVLIIDFQESVITKLSKLIGFSPEFEEAGNPNYHFKRKDLHKLFREMKINKYKIKSLLLDARPFKSNFFEKKFGFRLVKLIFSLFNLFLSKWGNVLLVVIVKE